jgi:dTMP kinase
MFIVIESIDGGGCQTQAELLTQNLEKLQKNNTYIKFPHYDTPVGKMIKDFLYDNKNLRGNEQFLLYSLQFVFDTPLIKEKSTNGIVIADRFFTTTLCYQTLEGVEEKVALRFAQDFGIIKPDLVFFLDVPVDTAMKWKYGEDKVLNFREKDKSFINKTYTKYQDLVKRNVWTNWIKINGERSKEEVSKEILQIVLEKYEQQN